MEFMVFVFVASLLGLITGIIAQGKGKSFVAWWMYGAALFIVALPHAIFMKEELAPGMYRKCPFCAETVKIEAQVCRFCRHDLPEFIKTASADEDPGLTALLQHLETEKQKAKA